MIKRLLRSMLERYIGDAVASAGAVKAITDAWDTAGFADRNARTQRERAEIAIRAFVRHVI